MCDQAYADAGWHLSKFLGSDEGELLWTQGTLTFPVRVNVAKAKYFQDPAQDQCFKVFLATRILLYGQRCPFIKI